VAPVDTVVQGWGHPADEAVQRQDLEVGVPANPWRSIRAARIALGAYIPALRSARGTTTLAGPSGISVTVKRAASASHQEVKCYSAAMGASGAEPVDAAADRGRAREDDGLRPGGAEGSRVEIVLQHVGTVEQCHELGTTGGGREVQDDAAAPPV